MIVNPPVSGMVRLRVPFHEFILGEKLSYWTKIFDLRKIFKGRKNIFALKKASDFSPWNQRLAFLILEIFNSAREKDFSLLRRGDWPERWRAWLMPHANESPKISQRPHFPQYFLLLFINPHAPDPFTPSRARCAKSCGAVHAHR